MKHSDFHAIVVGALAKMDRVAGEKKYASENAEDIIMMTCMHESGGLKADRQIGGGPALGYGQMERATFNDTFLNYLRYRPTHLKAVLSLLPPEDFNYETINNRLQKGFVEVSPEMLVDCVAFAVGMTRIHYLRVSESLPTPQGKDREIYLKELASYAKKHYNRTGKATPEKYFQDYLANRSKW